MSDSRNGSEKLVFEHLISIRNDSAYFESLPLGISSGELDDRHQEFSPDLNTQEDNNNGHVGSNQNENDRESIYTLGIVYKLQCQQIQENPRRML